MSGRVKIYRRDAKNIIADNSLFQAMDRTKISMGLVRVACCQKGGIGEFSISRLNEYFIKAWRHLNLRSLAFDKQRVRQAEVAQC